MPQTRQSIPQIIASTSDLVIDFLFIALCYSHYGYKGSNYNSDSLLESDNNVSQVERSPSNRDTFSARFSNRRRTKCLQDP